MKSLMKKLMAGVLSAVIMSTLLAGCGGQPAADTTDTQQTASTASGSASSESSAAPEKTLELEYWYGLGGKLGETMKALIDDFNSSQKAYAIKGVAQGSYDETYQALQAAIASGSAPACFLTTSPTVNALAQKSVLENVQPYADKDSSFNLPDFVQAFLPPAQVNNGLYGIPAYGTTQIMYYRKDIFEKKGISPDVLKSWESLEKASSQLTEKSGSETSVYGWEPMWGAGNIIDATLSAGGTVLSADGKTVTVDDKIWVDTWEYFRRNIHDSKAMRIHSGGQGWEYWYKTIDDVMQGKAAGYIGSSGDQGDLDFTKIAAYEQPGWNGGLGKPVASSQFLAIPSAAKDEQKQGAFEWMKFFTNAKNTGKWSMSTGYIPARLSAQEDADYKAYLDKNPQAKVPLTQASHASAEFLDPTGGKIMDALSKACDKVEIENVPAAKALKEAKDAAQKALDEALKK